MLDLRFKNLDAHHPTFIGDILLSHKREKEKKYHQACLDQQRHFHPLWFVGMEGLEMKPRCCSTTTPCRKHRQEIRKALIRNIAIVQGKPHICIRGSRILNLWKHQTDCILDRITNLDAPSNIHGKPEAVLLSHERETKKKYLQACRDQRAPSFLSSVVSCDGVIGSEAKLLYDKTLQEASPKNQERPIPKLHTSLTVSQG